MVGEGRERMSNAEINKISEKMGALKVTPKEIDIRRKMGSLGSLVAIQMKSCLFKIML